MNTPTAGSGEATHLSTRMPSAASPFLPTWIISLGSFAIRSVVRPDPRFGVSASDHERPLVAGVNGTATLPEEKMDVLLDAQWTL